MEMKNELIHCRVDLTPIEKDSEGQLRGGFVGISASASGAPLFDNGCEKNTNCPRCEFNYCSGTTPAPTPTAKSSKIMMDFFSGGLF